MAADAKEQTQATILVGEQAHLSRFNSCALILMCKRKRQTAK
jgi:hypothetical protein